MPISPPAAPSCFIIAHWACSSNLISRTLARMRDQLGRTDNSTWLSMQTRRFRWRIRGRRASSSKRPGNQLHPAFSARYSESRASEPAHSPGMRHRGANRLIKVNARALSGKPRETNFSLCQYYAFYATKPRSDSLKREDMIYLERRAKDLRAIPQRVSKNNGMLLQCKKGMGRGGGRGARGGTRETLAGFALPRRHRSLFFLFSSFPSNDAGFGVVPRDRLNTWLRAANNWSLSSSPPHSPVPDPAGRVKC